MAEKYVNAKGLQCPGPIVQLFNAIKEVNPGDIVVVEATDHGFLKDVQAWCKKTKNELLSLEEKDDVITAKIKKS